MGQSPPKDSRRQVRGGIQVLLEKLAYTSNEVISGIINVNLDEPFQGHFLLLNLQGVEDVHYTYTVGSGDNKSTIYAKAINNFLNYTQPIYDFAQADGNQNFITQPNQFSIPFELVIAEQLPSSIKYFQSEDNRCTLKYFLTAQILSTDPGVKPLSGSQEIFIGQQILIQDIANENSSIQKPIICCCCESGTINYKIQLSKRCFVANEVINIKVHADFSQYGHKVNYISVYLIGKLSLKAGQEYQDKTKRDFIKKIDVLVDKKQVTQEVQLEIPDDIMLTCQGQLIQMNYYLQIIPDIRACCCVTDLSPHETLIYISPNQSLPLLNYNIEKQLFQLPKYWNPIYLQQTQFNPIQYNQMQQLHKQNLDYETQLYQNQISIDPSLIHFNYQQEMIGVQKQIQNQSAPTQYQQQNQVLYDQQLNNQQYFSQNYYTSLLNQTQGQEIITGQPQMKDQNKFYL
ncbi:hypothetical protein ABPG74_011233 [Tetrahymena malaccensis]